MVQNTTSDTRKPITFFLPDFLAAWPYERLVHPSLGSVDVESASWVNDHHLFNEKAQKSFDASLFGLLGCLIFPLNSRNFCRVGCDLANAYFVIDEYNDVADPEVAGQVCDTVMDVLRNPYKERKSGDKLGAFMQGFWQRALALTTPGSACINHFVHGFDLYMKSMIVEAEDRETKRVRPVEDYLQLRRETFGAEATISLLGFGLELPEEVLSHPVIKSMTLAAMDLLCITNDMHSYPVELARGIAFHNIVTSIIHEHKLDVPGAMAWLERFGKHQVETFLDGIEELPSWGPEIDANVLRYIESIGYLVRGADAWSYESERYWGKKGLEIQITRLVTLSPEAEESQEGFLTKEELRVAMDA
ncbi:terpenoid synthase [Macrolepiota fuliginosa MF-IS2]|uniref:Terpene synthase n=1 Tax=Macrolepiota fuliginosa MF-IS2 TaxID=1400762 RepID=A0A9P5X6L5_9AGAR|nr:terpenoid synthase [Macrolepiota fuliginosa MF-IS2]